MSVSPEAWPDRVRGMIEDIDRIGGFIAGRSREEFLADEQAIFAVSYAFVRLGEAVHHIPREVCERHPQVEWGDIKHFRNFMIHVYHAVDPGRLFDTVEISLPPLREKLVAML